MSAELPPIWVISLPRSVERRAPLIRNMAALGLPFEFFDAIDGSALPEQLAAAYSPAAAIAVMGRELVPAEIGASLSHLQLYRRQVEQGPEVVVIFEDDALVTEAFAEVVAAVLRLPDDWDLVLLQRGVPSMPPVFSIWGRRRLGAAHQRIRPMTPVDLAAGYILRRSGAAKLLKHGYPVRVPPDTLFGGSIQMGLRLYAISPPVVIERPGTQSTLQAAHDLRAGIAQQAERLKRQQGFVRRAKAFLRERAIRFYRHYSPFARLKIVNDPTERN